MNTIYNNTCIVKTKIGNFLIEIKNNKISKIFPTNTNETLPVKVAVFRLVKKEINFFLEGKITDFSFSTLLEGTNFQKKVWAIIKKIKYGKTSSYLDIANKINSSPRAVGRACSKNKCLFIVPCHRVIYSNGSIGEYVLGNNIKRYLLKMEKN
ncbi:MAG: Methylated-DNA--protein-cysteine methyltransferase [Alphaproteobacteria bacterium MarineAlpha9_Bin4]|nr:cysteine methyltransferase [Pelagibacterales bacterium]PPR26070.1 MAG: Methylated-DNA--protein-cysteine methyltransferase [Alphaproteobacteria bacterium MarineAlpha9_Bin4]